MTARARRAWRLGFLIAGIVATTLPIGILILVVIARARNVPIGVSRGIFLYLAIAAICFYAVWRLKPPREETRAFEVIARVEKNGRID